MSRFTDAEREEIRAMFRQLADIQAAATIAQLEANPNATIQISVPTGELHDGGDTLITVLGGQHE